MAAAQAVKAGKAVMDIDVKELQRVLRQNNIIVD